MILLKKLELSATDVLSIIVGTQANFTEFCCFSKALPSIISGIGDLCFIAKAGLFPTIESLMVFLSLLHCLASSASTQQLESFFLANVGPVLLILTAP